MKRFLTVVCISTIIFLFTACSLFRPVNQKTPPATSAAELWQFIKLKDNYSKWDQFDDAEGLLQAAPPHGPLVKIYANDIATGSTYTGRKGSIVIMENYENDGKTLLTINLMQKRPGYAPSAGDWFWATYEPSGKVLEEGKIKSCVECHVSMAFDDYTFIHKW
ncbi:cytochrome P460 family protein [Halodesulfovibrio spirochaetisodalis]|uniref:cytochrome P460 family protein n=1 Tax=Halodesulfovibrio spirochaetisodalis TaxID=1560234 RepID=UPI00082C326F|nr:cytochrome P460 family protein [Halodesulfovibrio spirochaetisodalis]